MPDFEIIILKAGIIMLVSLSVVRMVVQDVTSLKQNFKRSNTPRKKEKRLRS